MAGGGEPGSSACFAASCEGTQNVAVVPDEKIVAEHTQKLAKILDVYEVQLSKHKYLAGEFVSIADLSHLPMTYYYFCLAKQPHLLTSRKHVNGLQHDEYFWLPSFSPKISVQYLVLISKFMFCTSV
jgi:glutathione S-transferase